MRNRINHKTAIFRQINQYKRAIHHDALEFPDGHIVLLTNLKPRQQATVLQMPAAPKEQGKPVVGRQLEAAES
jgi:hypothetical protein